MFALVKTLGRFVAKMYIREARLLNKTAQVESAASVRLAKAAEVAKQKSLEKIDASARVALQGQTISKFFL